MKTRLLAVAGTALGAVAGAGAVALGVATLPIALPVGIGAGIVVDVVRHKRHPAGPLTPVAMQAAQVMAPQVPKVVYQKIALTAANDPANPAAKKLDAFFQATVPRAVAAQAAAVAGGYPPIPLSLSVWVPAAGLVAAFQRAFNASPVSGTMGKLSTTGKFGGRTSAALTLYTHRVVTPDPSAGPND